MYHLFKTNIQSELCKEFENITITPKSAENLRRYFEKCAELDNK